MFWVSTGFPDAKVVIVTPPVSVDGATHTIITSDIGTRDERTFSCDSRQHPRYGLQRASIRLGRAAVSGPCANPITGTAASSPMDSVMMRIMFFVLIVIVLRTGNGCRRSLWFR